VGPVTILFGVLLLALGGGFFFGTGSEHFTALIPAAFGLVFIVLGALARQDNLRKHVMHAAAALGLIGVIVPLVQVVRKLSPSTLENPAAIEQLLMAVLCALFVALCVRSFIIARRSRAQSRGD
jgi:hypothetical protein